MLIGWRGRGGERAESHGMILVAEAEIDRLIAEDVGFGDLTTRTLGIAGRPGRIGFAARDPMVASATEEAARILARLGAVPLLHVASGEAAAPGTLLLEAAGEAAALHAGWKVAQTLIEWSAGIASAVREIRDAARAVAPSIVVACTRKSVPLTRALSIKAVLAGGGTMHRTGLGDTILLFPEHRAFLPDEPLSLTLARLRAAAPERAIVVEVAGLDDALSAAVAGADVVQLEKFTPDAVAALRARLAGAGMAHARIAAAGGINAANAAAYARAGADILVTSAPYTARPRDVQVRITAV
jgi:molybdenum transport protein